MNPLPINYDVPAIKLPLGILTNREIQIVERAILPDKQIAWDLDISYYTVLAHLKSIRNKTGIQDGRQLVYFGMKKGLIN